MKYVFGFDGGGTKTDCAIYTPDGNMVAWKRFGGTNHENFAGGFSDLEPILLNAIHETLSEAKLSPCEIERAVFGAAGVDVQKQRKSFETILAKSGLRDCLVVNDAYLGIKAATPEGVGCCLVNGTGNTVGGIDASGNRLQVGGMGPMLGEVGGAWLIARTVIRMAYDELFRLGRHTAITAEVMELLACRGQEDFVEQVYARYGSSACTDKQLVQILFRCAQHGDVPARQELERLGKEFARSLAGCIQRLSFGECVDIALVGSVTLKGECPLMVQTLGKELPRLTGKTHAFYPLGVPPVAGAVLWALENRGPVSRETRARILESAERAAKDLRTAE